MDVSVYAQPKVDTHCHVLDPNGFAYGKEVAYHPAGQETGTASYFEQVLDAYGVQHALLVGPNSGYGTDNRCLLAAIQASPRRFKGIAVVDNDAPTGYLQELKAQGIVGIAFNYALHGLHHYSDAGPLMERLAALGMFVQVQFELAQMQALKPMLVGSGAQLLLDHCGRPDLAAGLRGEGFGAVLQLADTGRASVKLSGFSKFSALPFPFSDTLPWVQALLTAYGPGQCIWASDWPFLKAPYRLDYGPLLQLFASQVPDPSARQKILWDTPRRLFGFA